MPLTCCSTPYPPSLALAHPIAVLQTPIPFPNTEVRFVSAEKERIVFFAESRKASVCIEEGNRRERVARSKAEEGIEGRIIGVSSKGGRLSGLDPGGECERCGLNDDGLQVKFGGD
ncbi:hypothetical protein HYALB_00001992 [Hymenoscyphus albidus]|uniref:Uncharacterized protein n=1 Tax=Hymenoscyphus albidus TaxID=595503 RepID=A0A9N9LDX4_9HELO|nr:hypothetical protein HYALB_00001992 [Hymenoscyphus albidus]